MQNPLVAQPGPIVIDNNRLGDLAEQWVSMLAAWKGAEVFPNVNCTGDTDIVMLYEGVMYRLDVKVSTYLPERDYWHAKNTHTVKAPVFPCIVEPDGDIADWRVRWHTKHVPPGLDEFWAKDYRVVSTKHTK